MEIDPTLEEPTAPNDGNQAAEDHPAIGRFPELAEVFDGLHANGAVGVGEEALMDFIHDENLAAIEPGEWLFAQVIV